MNIVVQNTGRFGYWLTLSDGRSVELSPKVGPISLPEREKKVNSALIKMLDKGLIRIIAPVKPAAKKVKTTPKSRASTKKPKMTTKPKMRES
ncbi:MAG: hypothetical protein PVJ19_17195 [Desulfobacteraceae bacterium]|jgi:hypothetical protein